MGMLSAYVAVVLAGLLAGDGELEHPAVPFLDAAGVEVKTSGAALSVMETCGACHDTDYIASHSYHVSLGTPAERRLRFDALTYDGGDPAELDAAGLEAWIRSAGTRHVGGGFASGTEMDCFLCHIAAPAIEQRAEALASGALADVPMATLARTGLVQQVGSRWRVDPDALDATGAPAPEALGLQAPTAQNCGVCHGAVEMDHDAPFFLVPSSEQAQTATTGVIFAPGRIRRSGMNVAGKDELTRPWDVHAERLLGCVDCHGSLNNPALYRESSSTRPKHLRSEARRLDLSEYLRTPSHNFAKGSVAQASAGAEFADTMRRCEDCHDASASHDFLPYRERHFESMQCEACHIPKVHAAALESIDWTMLTPDGDAQRSYRGVEGDPADPRSLVTGYTPVLLAGSELQGRGQLTPQNLVSVFFWFDEARGARVPLATLRAALFEGGGYRPELLALLDANADGRLEAAELHLTEQAAVRAVARALVVAGAAQPVVRGELESYGVHHGVAPGSSAVRDCAGCHGTSSRFSEPLELASYLPAGLEVTALGLPAASPVALAGTLSEAPGGGLTYHSDPRLAGMNPLGFEPGRWVDRVGLWLVLLTLCGVLVHGGTRVFLFYHVSATDRLPVPGTPGATEESQS